MWESRGKCRTQSIQDQGGTKKEGGGVLRVGGKVELMTMSLPGEGNRTHIHTHIHTIYLLISLLS